MSKHSPFRVVFSGDFHESDGRPKFRDTGLDRFDGHDHMIVESFKEHRNEVGPDQLSGANGAIVLSPRVTARSLEQSADLLAVVRFGVGYDSVDVPACTAADVLLVITVNAVDRSVAEATVGWMIALTHHFRTKDRLVREGRWDDRSRFMGVELRGRTLGVVGFGGIGRAVVGLLAGFGMNPPLVFDPFVGDEAVAEVGGVRVGLDELLEAADFVSIHCPLNDATRGLISSRELSRMKPDAYLINTARGGIVDESALFDALSAGKIAGAALDCFEGEPLREPPRFAALDNVLLAPHCVAWTDELFRDIGRTACRALLDVADGRAPRGIVNPETLKRPSFLAKWERLRGPLK